MNQFKTVKIAGREMPVAFNRFALGELMDDLELGMEDMTNLQPTLKTVQKFAYYGLVGGYAAKHRKEFEMSYMDACIELFHDDDGLAAIMEVWANQQPQAEPEKKTGKSEGKP